MIEQEKYDKAMQDLLQAKKSYLELTVQQRQRFIQEALKAEGMEQLLKALM